MNINPHTALKSAAIAGAALWGVAIIRGIGSFGLASVIIFSIGGALFGLGWYVAMRFVFEGMRPLPCDDRCVATPRDKFYRWMVCAGSIVLTGVVTCWLLGFVDPFIPGGDWRWLIKSLFVVIVWPGLMWSLRPFMKCHLPA